MSGYQRFVSYVYEYHKGKKGGNCGFVKVEVKDQKCRIELHLSCMGLTPCVECKIYGIKRNEEMMEGIFLGSCMTAENRAEGVITVDAFDLDGRGIPFSRLGGLVLKTENGAFFGTEWDDQPICPEKFREAGSVQKLMPREKEDRTEEEEALFKEQQTEKTEELEQEQENGNPKKTEPELENIEEIEQGEAEVTESEETESEQTEGEKTEISESENWEKSKRENDDQERVEQTLENRGETVEPESQQEFLHTQEMAERVSEMEEGPRQRVSEPEFDPFGDGELVKAWKTQPRDFRNLNRQDWALRNNRFLMYGYYSFGHLLLGKKANGSYILGVPGRYDQQERFMANMFGFPFFRESKEIQLPRGKGGYWYRLIHTPNFHERKEGQ